MKEEIVQVNTEEMEVEVNKNGFTNGIQYREDVKEFLLEYKLTEEEAHTISEFIRKGMACTRFLVKKWAEYKELLRSRGVPEWFLESCEKTRYLPKRPE